MKTQVTVETTPEQELVIGLAQTGGLKKATKAEIKDYFGAKLDLDVANLDLQVEALMKSTKTVQNVADGT